MVMSLSANQNTSLSKFLCPGYVCAVELLKYLNDLVFDNVLLYWLLGDSEGAMWSAGFQSTP